MVRAGIMRLRRNTWAAVSLVGALALGRGCVPNPQRPGAAATSDGFEWSTRLDRGAPLVGKIWKPDAGAMVNEEAVVAALVAADSVLLGERHDNPDHHRLQARLIAELVSAGRKPTLALEMLEPDDDATVARYRSDPKAGARGLGTVLAWEKSGWPDWPEYLPIAEVAFQAGLPMVSANLPRSLVRAIVHSGLAALPPADVPRLDLDTPLPEPLETSLEQELRDSHCGQLPEALVVPMALAQRARDGQMAARMRSFPAPVVLIAGAGHIARDRGVPLHLRAHHPDGHIVSIAFVEVLPHKTTPESYAADFGASTLPFDFVWFTPRASDEDPCAGFRAPIPPHGEPSKP